MLSQACTRQIKSICYHNNFHILSAGDIRGFIYTAEEKCSHQYTSCLAIAKVWPYFSSRRSDTEAHRPCVCVCVSRACRATKWECCAERWAAACLADMSSPRLEIQKAVHEAKKKSLDKSVATFNNQLLPIILIYCSMCYFAATRKSIRSTFRLVRD